MASNPGSLLRAMAFVPVFICAVASAAFADVERIDVTERGLLADGKEFGRVGPYERLRGRLYFSVDPNAPENKSIIDIKLAPRDAQGRVTFSTDFVLLKPQDPARGNGRLLYEVNNRGSLGMLGQFNDAAGSNWPTTAAQAGSGFLMDQGYTLLWTGWSWDVAPGGDRLRADLPIATDGGKTIFGLVSGEISVIAPTGSAQHLGNQGSGYMPARFDDPEAQLTVRDTAAGPRTAIPREKWHFGYKNGERLIYDASYITLDGGFRPGAIYTVTYLARGPRVMGLGLAGIRDALLFFRGERSDRIGNPNPIIETGGNLPTAVLAFGNSQSARVLQTMLINGLVADGRGRLSFDGALLNIAGGGKGDFNRRFAQPGRSAGPDVDLEFPVDYFPFSTAAQTDPVLSKTASVLDRAGTTVPKLFYTNASTEYWVRSASLTHTAVDGGADLAPDPRARIYFMAGGQHRPNRNASRAEFAQCTNPLDYRPLLRGLLLHLDAWVTLKKEPPANAYPTLADKSLGGLKQYVEAMPKIPGLRTPTRFLAPPRLDFGGRFDTEGIADVVPPKMGMTYTTLVPLPDADGLDKGGIRMPELAAPLGTYTGWNPQNAATGAPERLAKLDGTFVPLPRNENERIARNDPRKSIAERYVSRQAYTEAYAAATLELAEKELVLGTDINGMVDRAGAFYDRVMAHDPADESCGYLYPRQ